MLVVGAEFDRRNVVSTFIVAILPPIFPPGGIEIFLFEPPNEDSNDNDDDGGTNNVCCCMAPAILLSVNCVVR